MSDDVNVSNVTTAVSFDPRRKGFESSPIVVAVAVLIVFVLSPVILCGNSLILTALYRFKRLRTPSNYLITSLATSDFGAGMFLPVGMYMELTSEQGAKSSLCIVPYCFAIFVCSASVLVMTAIAVDRFTSLAQPLRYNNLITHATMEKYILAFWVYAGLVALSPLLYAQCFAQKAPPRCTFLSVVDDPVRLFLFCTVYGPCAVILIGCYSYIYIVARYHARAIYTVEISLRQNQDGVHSRYGQTLAITVGLFICLWLPFQMCMMIDIMYRTKLLSTWLRILLAVPIFINSAINPWVYGYRNSEVRSGVQRVLEDFVGSVGFDSPRYVCPELLTATAHHDHAELNSFASHVRLCAVSPMRCTSLLLPTNGRTETSDITRDVSPQPTVEVDAVENVNCAFLDSI